MPPLRRDVSIWPADGSDELDEPIVFAGDSYEYLSFINEGTYGIPPLVTKTREGGSEKPPVAADHERVLLVNPGAILAIELGPVND